MHEKINHRHVTADKVREYRWRPVILAFHPVVLDRNVTFLKTHLAEALAESSRVARRAVSRTAVEERDHRHRRLLRACREGRATAAPPSSVKNSRRFTQPPHRRGRVVCGTVEAERLGRLEVDNQLELGWLHHR